MVPEMAQTIVKEAIHNKGLVLDYKVEAKAYLKHFSAVFFYMVQLSFLGCMFNIFKDLVLTSKRVVDDQIMHQNGIFPILSTTRVKVDCLNNKAPGEPSEAQANFFEEIEAEDY